MRTGPGRLSSGCPARFRSLINLCWTDEWKRPRSCDGTGLCLSSAALLVPVARFCAAGDVRGPPGAEILPPPHQSSLDPEPGEAQCATCAGDKPGPSVKCSFILFMVFSPLPSPLKDKHHGAVGTTSDFPSPPFKTC